MSSPERKSKKVSRRLAAIEKTLKTKLTRFYNQKIRNSKLPITVLRRYYENQVKIMIKKAVNEGYSAGISTLEDEIAAKLPNFPLFLSNSDIGNIETLTDAYSEQFWSTSGRLHDREIAPPTKIDEQGEIVPLVLFDITAAMIGLTALFAWGAFNESMTSKSQEVMNNLNSGAGGIQIDINIPMSTKLMFMTAEDIRVDKKICFPLHGMEFDAFDPKIPKPPLHRFCRCRLIPVLEFLG
jgi:hypothetical protein